MLAFHAAVLVPSVLASVWTPDTLIPLLASSVEYQLGSREALSTNLQHQPQCTNI